MLAALRCRWFGHKWEQAGRGYRMDGGSWVRYLCDRCGKVEKDDSKRVIKMPICDDCLEDPCECEPHMKWLTDQLQDNGPATICHTEDGDLGLWIGRFDETTPALAIGDTIEDLLCTAMHGADVRAFKNTPVKKDGSSE